MAQLVERDEQLATLHGLFAAAVGGTGHLVFVGAEAGAGKSALVQAFCDSVAVRARTLTGWCEPLSTPRPAGPLVDMSAGLGPPVTTILSRNDRAGLFDATLAAVSTADRPTVLVFEDVHWADDTTLDLLRFLGRRVGTAPLLVIATYRDDETGIGHPLRTPLGDLATQPWVSRMTVPPLSLDAVTELANDSGLDPQGLWARSGGNAFYLTELLHAAPDVVPSSVADAVIARSARLSADARYTLAVAAIAGSRTAPSVLLDVPGVGVDAIDECTEGGFLRFAPPAFTFRHELVRQAVLTSIGAARRQHLAALVLAALRPSKDNDNSTRLAELAESAHDRAAVAEFAPAAARRAAGLGAHHEAAAQYARALRFADDPRTRADLLEPLSVEQYLTGDLEAAISSREAALETRREFGELLRVGDNLRWLSRLHWYAGNPGRGDGEAAESLAVLVPLGPTAELAMSMSSRSQCYMLNGDNDRALAWGLQAIELATELDLPDVIAHASNNVGSAQVSMDDLSGIDRLRESLALALQINAEDHAARAYVNLAFCLVGLRLLDEAAKILDEGLAYCSSRDLDIQTPYLRASRALLDTHAGRWAAAEAEASNILAVDAITPIHRFVALLPLTMIRVRRGAPAAEVTPLVEELGRLAHQLDEVQRLAPYAAVRAEAAWLAGEDVSADAELLAIAVRSRAAGSRAELTELVAWLQRAGVPLDPPAEPAGPFRAAATDPGAAGEDLARLGCAYDAAVWLMTGAAPAVQRAHATFTGLGARPAVAAAQTRLRELGARIPRGPRTQTRTNQFGLTARQHEVLELVGERLTNAQIAQRLVLSERTVDHHVSAILTKLEVTSRDEAARKVGHQSAAS